MTGFVSEVPGETGAEAMQALAALYGLCDPPVRTAVTAIDIWAEPDVCGWPDEGPRDDPVTVAAWCAAVCKRNAAAKSPADDSGADWLEQGCRKHGVIPSGLYAVEILPRGMRQFTTAKTAGVSFLVGIVGGEHNGIECRLSFLREGPDAIVRRDLGILHQWGSALGVGRSRDIVDHVVQLGRAGKGRRVTLGIGSRETRNGVELACVSVEVRGPRDG